jgi:ParB family transcriptional regulator, chromosome partitioning protein
MAKKFGGLGRGLGALIPQKDDRTSPPQTPPSRAAVVIGAGERAIIPPAAASAQPVDAAPALVQPVVARPQAEATPTPLAPQPASAANTEVPVHLIVPDPNQPRKNFKHRELEDLAQSIKEHGIIQPITVAKRADGKYDLIAGERRFRAAGMLGLTKVPVTFRAAESQDKLLLALIENIQREDLNPIEEAEGYRRLITEFSLTQEDVSRKVGKARSTVANTLRLLDLPQEIRDALAQGIIPAGSARAILSLKDSASQIALFKKLVAEHLTTRDVEQGVRRRSGREQRRDPMIAALEEQLRDSLGSRVDIKSRAGRGAIIISFFSDEERDNLTKRLGA